MMRRVLCGLAPFLVIHLCAQTHKVAKPETVVRAVAVYEWTGDEGKPKASRIVPVSLFINGELQDAGVYMARPVPFALDRGFLYEGQKSGVPQGTLEIVYDRHLTTSSSAPADAEIDDGWMAYGPFKPKPKETLIAKKQSGPLPQVIASGGSKPHFANKGDNTASDPTTKSDSTAKSGSSTQDDDSNRPTFHRRPDSSASDSSKPSTPATTSTTTDAGSTSSDDPAERPTLKRRSPADIKADQKKKDSARVIAGNDLNDDPDRPNLHRGKPATHTDEDEYPPLQGLPKDMQQMVVVSDAKDRPEHDFRRPFESDAERAGVLARMEAFARDQLAAYKGVGPALPAPAQLQTSTAHTTATSKAKRRVPSAPAAPAPDPLNDEVLNGYTLSYGGAATYYYTANSPGARGATRYVSVVAQEEPITGLKVALANVTDSTHLDSTPQMRLVDVVDAEASNRASLLMELREAHTRQFALYRVIGAKADQVFITGTTE